MKKIEKIPQIKIISEYRGPLFTYLIYIGIPIFIIVGLFMTFDGFANEKYNDFFKGIMVMIIFGTAGVLVFKGGVYKPEKSFFIERMNKEKLNKFIIYSGIVNAVLCLIVFFIRC